MRILGQNEACGGPQGHHSDEITKLANRRVEVEEDKTSQSWNVDVNQLNEVVASQHSGFEAEIKLHPGEEDDQKEDPLPSLAV